MMGEIVAHSLHGKGTIRASRHKGLEVLVAFEDGLSRWVRSDELQSELSTDSASPFRAASEDLSEGQFKARRMVEAFRLGIVPHDCVEEFTFGRAEELRRIRGWLNDTSEPTFLVIGEYGSGKTHMLRFAYEHAMRAGFAAAYVSMDPDESPFFKPKRVYARLIQGLRYHDHKTGLVGGFREFLKSCLRTQVFDQHPYFTHLREGLHDEALWDWISGREVAIRPWSSSTGRVNRRVPGLYDYASSANIYCYLLSSLGWAAREVMGLKGLVLLFDEAEAIDRYFYKYQPKQGRNFLSALIRTAGDDKSLLQHPSSSDLEYCRIGSSAVIPFLYRAPCSLKLIFSLTHGYTVARLPELATPPGIELESLPDAVLGAAFDELTAVYRSAYPEIQGGRLTFDRIMSRITYHSGRTRRFVKATVEALDLLRLNVSESIDEVLK